MSDQISVSVVEFADRRHYQMQWLDPITGRKRTKSTGVERTGRERERLDAEKVAGKHQAELREGRYLEPSKISWDDFRERYEMEVLPGLAEGTDQKVSVTFNWVERVLKPPRLANMTESRISHLQAEMRKAGLETTIKSYSAHLAAALRWAARLGLLVKAPRIERPKRAKDGKLMKGRPIAGEEFDRMLDVVPRVLESRTRGKRPLPADPAVVESWRHFLRGLWLSGLRLSEALASWWDRDDRLCIDLAGKYPMLRIPAECEKGHKDRLLPMAPEFAEFLLATPEAGRAGQVFNPRARRPHAGRLGWQSVSAIICKIGKEARVKVATDARTGKVKYASAHDLRRSFGQRWAARVMPAVLQALMRHESIDTTMKYYVGRNAEDTARTLWEAHSRAAEGSNTFGNSRPKRPEAGKGAGDVKQGNRTV